MSTTTNYNLLGDAEKVFNDLLANLSKIISGSEVLNNQRSSPAEVNVAMNGLWGAISSEISTNLTTAYTGITGTVPMVINPYYEPLIPTTKTGVAYFTVPTIGTITAWDSDGVMVDDYFEVDSGLAINDKVTIEYSNDPDNNLVAEAISAVTANNGATLSLGNNNLTVDTTKNRGMRISVVEN